MGMRGANICRQNWGGSRTNISLKNVHFIVTERTVGQTCRYYLAAPCNTQHKADRLHASVVIRNSGYSPCSGVHQSDISTRHCVARLWFALPIHPLSEKPLPWSSRRSQLLNPSTSNFSGQTALPLRNTAVVYDM